MQMKTIESFKVDHNNLFPGLYVSRRDENNGVFATTFDIRMTAPNREEAMDSKAIHTIEHIGATYLRNCNLGHEVIYFGPMGCKTGFYLVVFGNINSSDVLGYVKDTFKFISEFEGEIPGATSSECGNYAYQDLDLAKVYAKKYLEQLNKFNRLEY